MTPSRRSGQTAPRSTDFGSLRAPRHGPDHDIAGATAPELPDLGHGGAGHGGAGNANAPWGSAADQPRAQNPAFGAPVHADAPTGTMPTVAGAALQAPGAGPAAAPPGTSSGPSSASSPPASSQPRARAARSRGPRRARLQLRHINPWTVLKFSCVLSIALFFVWLIVIGVLFGILDAAGIISKINDTVVQLNGPGSNPPVTAGIVFGAAAIIGIVNIVLFVALSTVGSVVYNLCADLVGGIEITLSER